MKPPACELICEPKQKLQPDNRNMAPFHPHAETFQNAKSLRGPWGSQTPLIRQSRHDPQFWAAGKRDQQKQKTLENG